MRDALLKAQDMIHVGVVGVEQRGEEYIAIVLVDADPMGTEGAQTTLTKEQYDAFVGLDEERHFDADDPFGWEVKRDALRELAVTASI